MKTQLCTQCKASISCNTADIDQCACKQLEISSATRAFLAQSFHKCLCNSCLLKMEQLMQYAQNHEFPKRRSQMEEGVHYYMENSYFVFTELYHMMKGQCCQNGCRHCVYGFKNQHL